MLINSLSFELGLMVGTKQAFLSVTPPNDFHTYSLDKFVHFVRSDMSETFFRHRTFFDNVTDECSNCQRWGNQLVQLHTLKCYCSHVVAFSHTLMILFAARRTSKT